MNLWEEYSDLTASNSRPSTPHSRNTSQCVPPGTRSYAFSWSRKHVGASSTYFHDLSKIFWRAKIWSVTVLQPVRKQHRLPSSFGCIVSRRLFKAPGMHLPREVKWRYAPVVRAFPSCLPSCAWGMINLVCQSFGGSFRTPSHLTHTRKLIQVEFHGNLQASLLSVFWQLGRLRQQRWYISCVWWIIHIFFSIIQA